MHGVKSVDRIVELCERDLALYTRYNELLNEILKFEGKQPEKISLASGEFSFVTDIMRTEKQYCGAVQNNI